MIQLLLNKGASITCVDEVSNITIKYHIILLYVTT